MEKGGTQCLRPALSKATTVLTTRLRRRDPLRRVVRERCTKRREERLAVDRQSVVVERLGRKSDDRQTEVRRGLACQRRCDTRQIDDDGYTGRSRNRMLVRNHDTVEAQRRPSVCEGLCVNTGVVSRAEHIAGAEADALSFPA